MGNTLNISGYGGFKPRLTRNMPPDPNYFRKLAFLALNEPEGHVPDEDKDLRLELL